MSLRHVSLVKERQLKYTKCHGYTLSPTASEEETSAYCAKVRKWLYAATEKGKYPELTSMIHSAERQAERDGSDSPVDDPSDGHAPRSSDEPELAWTKPINESDRASVTARKKTQSPFLRLPLEIKLQTLGYIVEKRTIALLPRKRDGRLTLNYYILDDEKLPQVRSLLRLRRPELQVIVGYINTPRWKYLCAKKGSSSAHPDVGLFTYCTRAPPSERRFRE